MANLNFHSFYYITRFFKPFVFDYSFPFTFPLIFLSALQWVPNISTTNLKNFSSPCRFSWIYTHLVLVGFVEALIAQRFSGLCHRLNKPEKSLQIIQHSRPQTDKPCKEWGKQRASRQANGLSGTPSPPQPMDRRWKFSTWTARQGSPVTSGNLILRLRTLRKGHVVNCLQLGKAKRVVYRPHLPLPQSL